VHFLERIWENGFVLMPTLFASPLVWLVKKRPNIDGWNERRSTEECFEENLQSTQPTAAKIWGLNGKG
jgi:hypothetical protein